DGIALRHSVVAGKTERDRPRRNSPLSGRPERRAHLAAPTALVFASIWFAVNRRAQKDMHISAYHSVIRRNYGLFESPDFVMARFNSGHDEVGRSFSNSL